MPAARCTEIGMKGCVAPLAGHACSVAPRNQMASAVRPADSAGPAIRIGGSSRFRREESFIDGAIEKRKKFFPLDGAAIETE